MAVITDRSQESLEGRLQGSVKIADDVISTIAALAATDVDGVAGMAGNMTGDIINKMGFKNHSKGVHVSLDEDRADINLSIIVRNGSNIPRVAARVQEKVKTTVENMTGLTVENVSVFIEGVDTSDAE